MIKFKKVSLEKDASEYYLITNWEDDEKQVQVFLMSFQADKYFNGLLTDDFMRTKSLKMRTSYEQYKKETKIALTYDNGDDMKFVYDIKCDGDDFIFEWKKFVEEEQMKILLGFVTLSTLPMKDTVEFVFEIFITEMNKLNNQIRHLTEEERLANENRGEALDLLEKTSEWKVSLEKELYSKFVIVLNSKKEKIKELTNEIEQLKKSSNSNEPIVGEIVSQKSTAKKIEKNTLDIFSDDLDIKPVSRRVGRYVSKSKAKKSDQNNTDSDQNNTDMAGPSNSKRRRATASKNRTQKDQTSDNNDSDDLFGEL